MLYHACTTITGVDLAHYGISRAKDWLSVDFGTRINILRINIRTAGVSIPAFLLLVTKSIHLMIRFFKLQPYLERGYTFPYQVAQNRYQQVNSSGERGWLSRVVDVN